MTTKQDMEKLKLVFIVSTSRSGTTMMCRILNLHPGIIGTNELHYFNDLISIDQLKHEFSHDESITIVCRLLARIKNSIWNTDDLAIYRNQAESILNRGENKRYAGHELYSLTMLELAEKDGLNTVVEQTPKNVLYMNQLSSVYENALFINLVRDPRAVLFSQKNRWMKRKLGSRNIPLWNVLRVFFNYHPYTIMKLWNQSVNIGRRFSANPNYLKVKFEDLTDQPEAELKRICSFLGVDFDPLMLDIPQLGSSNMVNDEAQRGINKSVNEQWKTKLGRAEIWMVEKYAKKNMQSEGYELLHPAYSPKVILLYLYYPVHVLGAVVFNPKIVFRTFKALGGKKK